MMRFMLKSLFDVGSRIAELLNILFVIMVVICFKLRKQMASEDGESNSIKQLKMKAKVYRTKPGCVDYNDLTVICNIEEACEAIRNGTVKNVWQAHKAYNIP